jgi:hypothetical protein
LVDVSFKINGKIVEPDSMKDVLDITFMKHIRESIENSIGSIRCPEHGGEPSIIVRGQNLDSLEYKITGCCEEFVKKVRTHLK